MGSRGRLAMSDNVRQLRGNPGKRKSPETLKAKPGTPSPPTWLDTEAKAEWRRVVPGLDAMGILAKIDRGILADYCHTWSLFTRAARKTQNSDFTQESTRTDTAQKTADPMIAIYKGLASLLSDLARQLGLTPAARLRLTAPKKDEEGDREDLLR